MLLLIELQKIALFNISIKAIFCGGGNNLIIAIVHVLVRNVNFSNEAL
jgi:hypothetical protein